MSPRYLPTALLAAVLLAVGAPNAATISGKVLDITAEGAPVANQDVTLQIDVMSQSAPSTKTTKSNTSGEFTFRNIDAPPGRLFRVSTQFEGVEQGSQAFHVSGDSYTQNLPVHGTVTEPDNITVEKTHLIVAPDEEGVAVTAVYIVQNWAGIYVGKPEDGSDGPIGLKFYVPDNGIDFQVMQGRLTAHHKVTPWGFATTVPFSPGSDTLVYAYRIPWDGNTAQWDVMSPYPTTSLSVITMAGAVDVDVEGGQVIQSEMGPQVMNIERAMVPAGEPVTITARPAGTSTSSAGQYLVIFAGAAMIAVVLFALYVRGRQKSSGTDSPAPATSAPVESAPAESDLTREAMNAGAVDALVEAIAALDEQYEKGELGEAEYVQSRRQLKRDLVEALKQEEL